MPASISTTRRCCLLFVHLVAAAMLCVATAAAADIDPDPGAAHEFFETRIRPLLAGRCYECHGARKQESGLRLDSLQAMLDGGDLGRAVVPGEPGQSLLLLAVRHEDELRMPPKQKLSTRQIADLTRWIEMGSPWPNETAELRSRANDGGGTAITSEDRAFWAFQTLAPPALPAVANPGWSRTPIDRFVLGPLEAHELLPAAAADRRTWIRRVTFDLQGVPPTPEEVAAFVADDSPLAFERVVDRLLTSPRYGERWGRHWLDVVRYADSNGLDENLCYAHAWRYRDYVIDAFNRDQPYDAFVREQVAGDLMPADDDEFETLRRQVATGFLALGAKMLACDDGMKMRMDIIDEQLNTLGQSVLGMTLGCARCHDHKFDPIPSADYYALAGIFKSTKTMENYQVVAKWYERPVAPASVIEAYESHLKEVESRKAEFAAAEAQADRALLTTARRHAADYLLAGVDFLRQQELLAPLGARLQREGPAAIGSAIVVEAEKFDRGNSETLVGGYGDGIGVIATRGGAEVEYDLIIPSAGKYFLALRYAAEASRPLTLSVNGTRIVGEFAGGVTGGWYPRHQQWRAEVLLELDAGSATIRLARDEPFPHVDKLAVIPAAEAGYATEATLTASASSAPPQSLIHSLVQAWSDVLASSRNDPDSVLAAWHTFAAATREAASEDTDPEATISEPVPPLFGDRYPTDYADAADRYRQLFDRVLAEALSDSSAATTPEVAKPRFDNPLDDAAWDLLFDPAGPFKLPPDARQYDEPPIAARLAKLRREIDEFAARTPPAPVRAMGVTEGPEVGDMPIHHRGSYLTPGEVVPRGYLKVLDAGQPRALDDQASGRLQLAQWLTEPHTPAGSLAARVIANRVWRWHFGVGIVPSTDNFGRLGAGPTNAPLLEYLADSLVDHGWSLKALHRELVLSATYRMSTAYDAHAAVVDPENRLLWRMNRRRLEAEAVRDSLLAVAGQLDWTMGGTVLRVNNREYVTVSGSRITDEYDQPRRTVYLPVVRSSMYDALTTFDFPDPAVPNGNRATTTIAPQALFLTNSRLVHDQMGRLAKQLLDRLPTDEDRVVYLYELLYGRAPSKYEITRSCQFVADYQQQDDRDDQGQSWPRPQRAWQALCRVLVSTTEFIYVE